jgi:hypothetical protein
MWATSAKPLRHEGAAMAIKLPTIPARQAPGNAWQRDRARWHAELRRRNDEVTRRDRAAFLKYKGA